MNLLELLTTSKVTKEILFKCFFFLQEDFLMTLISNPIKKSEFAPLDFAVEWFSPLGPRNRFSHYYSWYFYSR